MFGIGEQVWFLASRMAPYLLFGFLVSAILYAFVPATLLRGRLGGGLGSVAVATIIGAPLPLCSCSVLPVALSLRQCGASNGATAAFLVATPITSVDSILATYAFFGLPFTLFRLAASVFVAFLAGCTTHFLTRSSHPAPSPVAACNLCRNPFPHSHTIKERIVAGFLHGFVRLPREIGGWIVWGIVLGGVIASLLPRNVGQFIGGGWLGPPVLLAVGLPLYVCSTGSVPVAAGFVASGFTLGSALVFLLVGPATNIVPLLTLWRVISARFVLGLVVSVAAGALLAAYILDALPLHAAGLAQTSLQQPPPLFYQVAGLVLLGLILAVYLSKLGWRRESSHENCGM
ncbi:MAG: hypothetical protein DRP63_08800 [Planctomycetota bacterium]|mgnify:FL=1|nr:MAG: hypothetical protein DRP63_08800 [Planctomycetota bacterium]